MVDTKKCISIINQIQLVLESTDFEKLCREETGVVYDSLKETWQIKTEQTIQSIKTLELCRNKFKKKRINFTDKILKFSETILNKKWKSNTEKRVWTSVYNTIRFSEREKEHIDHCIQKIFDDYQRSALICLGTLTDVYACHSLSQEWEQEIEEIENQKGVKIQGSSKMCSICMEDKTSFADCRTCRCKDHNCCWDCMVQNFFSGITVNNHSLSASCPFCKAEYTVTDLRKVDFIIDLHDQTSNEPNKKRKIMSVT